MTDAHASGNLLSLSVGVVIILTAVRRASALPVGRAPVRHSEKRAPGRGAGLALRHPWERSKVICGDKIICQCGIQASSWSRGLCTAVQGLSAVISQTVKTE